MSAFLGDATAHTCNALEWTWLTTTGNVVIGALLIAWVICKD